ncbi:MAG: hypothetical protein KJ728_12010 [Alphaproteobacteria bacterium]|nr:hypothetical protein [Alphaproteobacteria bacterium]MBU1522133.1 hypothetical protein [Alphaproteobacteria bacterium]MBU2031461.1 hypothetical protein [Alphaproteobacteria bacterium]MBU2165488.1 hypothetical protein [Alphaproteobacteria bacterium]MBU2229894.1 hypothetical protein [Alphaproteobacteria bacterium]
MENPMTKTLFAAAAASLLLVGAASAQTAPAPAPEHASDHAHDEHHARPTIESPIEALVNDPATKAVLEKHLPGMDKHPAYGQFKGMTLRQVAPYSQGHITDEKIAAIDADLKALPAA